MNIFHGIAGDAVGPMLFGIIKSARAGNRTDVFAQPQLLRLDRKCPLAPQLLC